MADHCRFFWSWVVGVRDGMFGGVAFGKIIAVAGGSFSFGIFFMVFWFIFGVEGLYVGFVVLVFFYVAGAFVPDRGVGPL